MKKEEKISDIFKGTTVVSLLHSLEIRTSTALRLRCLDKKQFVPLKVDKLKVSELHDLNYSIAQYFFKKRLISEQELKKQLPLSCYYAIIRKRARRALAFNGIRTVRDLCSTCIEERQFKSLKGKKIGPRVNYEAAQVLHHLGYLSEKAFLAVPLPSWKTRLLTDREIGMDGRRKLHKLEWSDIAKEVIIRAVSLKFKDIYGGKRNWQSITLGELVKTFVRIDPNGTPVFYEKGHTGSHWYSAEWFQKRFNQAFTEIAEKLRAFDFLPQKEIAA